MGHKSLRVLGSNKFARWDLALYVSHFRDVFKISTPDLPICLESRVEEFRVRLLRAVYPKPRVKMPQGVRVLRLAGVPESLAI